MGKAGARGGRRLPTDRQIALMPVGAQSWPDEPLLGTLGPIIGDVFAATVLPAGTIPLPDAAYDPSRRQYHSTVLLDTLARHKRAEWSRLLGIADVDLYTPDLNFVFGEADASRGVAVFSVARLHTVDRDQFVHRAATEAIHELGHTYRLRHCRDSRCVMWFSNTLEESDRKGTRFCPAHGSELQRALS
jgi:archaemetzincin